MIPKKTLKKIMKETADNYPKVENCFGLKSDIRISDGAVEELDKHLEKVIINIMVKAKMNAKRNGRKTIKREDIISAIEDDGFLVKLIERLYGVNVEDLTA